MNLEYFPHFMKINYPEVAKEATEEDYVEIGQGFKEYLERTFKGKEDKLAPIWDIDAKTVIMNQVNKNPFMVNGYNPGLIIHFDMYVKEQIKKSQENGN